MPSLRAFAREQGVSHVTAVRAYDWLRREGRIATRPGARAVWIEAAQPSRSELATTLGTGLSPGFERASRRADVRSFATAFPDPDWIDPKDWVAALGRAAELAPIQGLPGPPNGSLRFRRAFAAWAETSIGPIPPGSMCLGHGALATLDVVVRACAISEAPIWVSEPMAPDYLDLLRAHPAGVEPIPWDRLASAPSPGLVVLDPIAPLGGGESLPATKWRALLAEATRRRVPVVQMAAGAALTARPVEGLPHPNIVSILGFDAVVSPAMAASVVVASGARRAQIARAIFRTSIGVPEITRRCVEAWVVSGAWGRHLEVARRELEARRRAFDAGMTVVQPPWRVSMGNPVAAWVEWDSWVDAEAFGRRAIDAGFAVLPGDRCLVEPTGRAIRVAFGLQSVESCARLPHDLFRLIREINSTP